ncbi:hypothetical protein FACS1894219_04140 [Clostridia bacterium]|nr:hypothetical protein FACS1894219_04140 [Clostridia bacterium]
MAKFCMKCGAPLGAGKFCQKCGTPAPQAVPAQPVQAVPAQAPSNICPHCGAAVTPGTKFCIKCGGALTQPQTAQAPNSPAPQPAQQPLADVPQPAPQPYVQAQQPAAPAPQPAQQPIVQAQQVYGQARQTAGAVQRVAETAGQLFNLGGDSAATASAGEMTFDFQFPSLGSIGGGAAQSVLTAVGAGKALLNGFTGVFKNLAAAFKNPKALIPALIMVILWVGQSVLPLLNVELPESAAKILGFLTFARSGMGGGFGGAARTAVTTAATSLAPAILGEALGKGMLAGLIASLFAGGKPFSRIGGGVKTMFTSFKCKRASEIGLLLGGAGAALIGQNFMAGQMELAASMAAVSALLMALRSLGSSAGFLKQFAGSLLSKKGLPIDIARVNKTIGGLTAGFALAVPLSALPFGYIGYALGAAALIIGAVLVLTEKKEVAVA